MNKLSTKQWLMLGVIVFINCGISRVDNANPKIPNPLITLPAQELFFDTHFLSQYDLVHRLLCQKEDFEEINFINADGILINGLLRKKTNAPYTIIFCAGFYPGRKEGLASFVKMVPQDTNILFFDARGHGKSGGRFFTNLHNYGINEYKDVIAAVECIHLQFQKPIFIHGICAGAFHAAQALTTLDIEKYQIKGLIFDSGLISIVNSCSIPEKYFREKVIPSLVLTLYKNDSKQTVKNRLLCKILCTISGGLVKLATVLVKPSLEKNEHQINLSSKMAKITCPIFFIHSYDDCYSPISDVMTLSHLAPKAKYWWLEHSEHALNHLKHTQEYQLKLQNFIEDSLMQF